MLARACGDAGFDVAVVGLRVCAVVGEHARCELMPGAGGQLVGVGRTVCARRGWEMDRAAVVGQGVVVLFGAGEG